MDAAERAELAGEWPPGLPRGTAALFRDAAGRLWVHDCDPRVVFSAELIDSIVDNPVPGVFLDTAGCDTYIGALLKVNAANRRVVYRLVEWVPSIRGFVGEWPD